MKKLLHITIVLSLLLLISCKNKTESETFVVKEESQQISATDSLHVLATEEFFELALIDSLSQKFLEESKTKLIWENGGSKKEIIDKLAESDFLNYPDLVLGLSNVFYTELDSLDIFRSLKDVYFSNVRSNNRFDKSKRFVPYQYSYLALIKKTSNKNSMPKSFGVMQKEEYFDKIIICDAIETEYGRALFNQIEGIFKFHGYASCWNRIKGGIFSIEDNENDAWGNFWKHDDKYIFHPVTDVIHGYEAGYPPTMEYIYMAEGSYKMIHSAAITQRCKNITKAEVFLLWLHKLDTQSFIVKNTNWYPIIEYADKSEGHRVIDFPTKVINHKINQRVVEKYLAEWLDYWKIYKRNFNEQ